MKTAAIGLNFADLFVRAGVYPRTPEPPMVPGLEISGTVEAVGAGVAHVSTGRPVVAVPIFGGHAERVVVDAKRVFPLPDGVDLVEAAAVPVAFLTAWYACARAQVVAGDRVVLTAAAGGVGTALLQLLRERGARALALAGSERKLALCREPGAEEAGVYDRGGESLGRAFGGRADVVVDAIGGRLFARLWRRLDVGGRYVLYGFAAASGERGVARARALREPWPWASSFPTRSFRRAGPSSASTCPSSRTGRGNSREPRRRSSRSGEAGGSVRSWARALPSSVCRTRTARWRADRRPGRC